ncbi:hypothetical protein HMPREF9540_02938 [Escherichia coli MS 115-1]|nr:hypothetical protein HMPREF9540_02938 [Escherichia coli MS 115-1]
MDLLPADQYTVMAVLFCQLPLLAHSGPSNQPSRPLCAES